jgi:hypothetical protein
LIRVRAAVLAVLAGLGFLPPALAAPVASEIGFPPPGKIRFTIVRGGVEIGVDEIDFSRDGDRLHVHGQLEVAIGVVGITYFHLASHFDEEWADGELRSFVAESNHGGKLHHVQVLRQGGALAVTENGSTRLVAAGILPATLWNPAIVGATQLIDPINGKLRAVLVTDMGKDTIIVHGESVVAHHIAITGNKMNRDVWYGPDGRVVYFRVQAGDGSVIAAELR